MSHSSLTQTSARHQSPEVRHGPEAQITLPRTRPADFTSYALMRVGRPCLVCTSARQGGRKTLNPITHCRLPIADCRLPRDLFRVEILNRFMRKASGRCVSKISGEPTLSAPTNFANRARVTSSFSGSGANGINRPVCATRGFTGSAKILTEITAASGGCASGLNKGKGRNVLGVVIWAGQGNVPSCFLFYFRL